MFYSKLRRTKTLPTHKATKVIFERGKPCSGLSHPKGWLNKGDNTRVAHGFEEIEHVGRSAAGHRGDGVHLRLVGDPDKTLREGVVLLALSEIGGYMLVARRLTDDTLLAYHAADLDLVDGLITALQTAYHLQPEVRV